MSSRQQRRGRRCNRRKHRAREEKKNKGEREGGMNVQEERNSVACSWNKDLVTLCGTVATEPPGRRLAVTNPWRQTITGFGKMSLRLKPLIWPFCDHLPHLHLPRLLLSLRLLSPWTVCKYWFSHIWSNTFLKYVNWTTLTRRTGIPKRSLAARSNKYILKRGLNNGCFHPEFLCQYDKCEQYCEACETEAYGIFNGGSILLLSAYIWEAKVWV